MPVQTHVQLGNLLSVEITLRDEAWLGAPESVERESVVVTDVAAATSAALKDPIGFPPISQAMVPGDHIAIALGEGVRQAPDVVRGIVAALEWAGAGAEVVTVVTGSLGEASELRDQLEDLTTRGCTVVGHEADDDQALCYLAAVNDAPLMIGRQLFEADVVIPIGCGRARLARDARGSYEAIYPRYSDAITQRRYTQADAVDSPAALMQRRRETDQAGWLLGAALVVQVVPARGGGVTKVVAGTAEEVDKMVASVCDSQWMAHVNEPASLVVAALSGPANEQTWENVARALHAAGRAADQAESAVAICTQLDTPPGETLQKLIATGGDLERAAQLHDAQSPDAAAAWEIYKALCRGPVYFMSELDAEIVEEMGMTPIADTAELTRLAERSRTCVILNESQHTVPKIAD